MTEGLFCYLSRRGTGRTIELSEAPSALAVSRCGGPEPHSEALSTF